MKVLIILSLLAPLTSLASPCGKLVAGEYCINLSPTDEEVALYCTHEGEDAIFINASGAATCESMDKALERIDALQLESL